MKKATLCLSIIILIFASCSKDSGPYIVKPPPPPPPEKPVLVSFSKEIQPIFDNHCVSCHNENHSLLNLKPCCSWYELLATGHNVPYLDSINPDESKLLKRITGAVMPIMPPTGNPLAQEDIDLIKKWIGEGARNN